MEKENTLICKLPSGWVSLCGMQFLSGYCILTADPMVESINVLDENQRTLFLKDMVLIGDAIMQVTGAYRINYAIMGNSEPYLHAHIVPRYLEEPEPLRRGLPWSHPDAYHPSTQFKAERDQSLINTLRKKLQNRCS